LSSVIRLIISFLSDRKFGVSVEGEFSTPRRMQSVLPHGSILSPTLYNFYINDNPEAPAVHLALFAEGTCLYTAGVKAGYILRKLQHIVTSPGS